MTWPMHDFVDAVEDASAGNTKLPQSAYSAVGPFPVVDQGQRLIAGYTDDESLTCRVDRPVIVFGDHTRAFKYVDFPFVIGADGVKVLRVRNGWDTKYVFHYLRSRDLPSAGYSRHFKFLREVRIPKPPLEEQRRVAAILDQADALRARRREALAHLDALTASIFIQMFEGESCARVGAGDLMPSMRNGVSPATAGEYPAQVLTLSAVTQGAFDPTAAKPGLFAVSPPKDRRVSASDFLMCRGNGNKELVGVGTFSREDRPDLVFPDTVIAGRVDLSKITMSYLEAAWKQQGVRNQIKALARTTNGTYKVNQQALSSVVMPLPPRRCQEEFDVYVSRVNAQRAAVHRAAATDDELIASIQSDVFGGAS